MMFLMGFGGIIYELSALIYGTYDGWLGLQMKHVAWEGFRQHDTIFPLFIFLSGVSFPFSYAAAAARGMGRGAVMLKAAKRLVCFFFSVCSITERWRW
jgi:predicted acyltransferase